MLPKHGGLLLSWLPLLCKSWESPGKFGASHLPPSGKAHQGCVQVGSILVPVGRWEALADQKGNSLTLPGHGRAKENYHHQDCFNPSFLIGQGTITSPTPVLSPCRNLNFICLGQESVPRVPASCVHLAAWVICLTPRSDPVIAWIRPLEASRRRISNPLERHPSPSHLASASLVVCSSPNTSNVLPPQDNGSCYAFGPRAHSQYLPGCLPHFSQVPAQMPPP